MISRKTKCCTGSPMFGLHGHICGKQEVDSRPSSLSDENILAGRGEIKRQQAIHPEDVVFCLWVWEGTIPEWKVWTTYSVRLLASGRVMIWT